MIQNEFEVDKHKLKLQLRRGYTFCYISSMIDYISDKSQSKI